MVRGFSVPRGGGSSEPAVNEVAIQTDVKRPTIGLVLGGGAARGFAHIGVIRTLLAHGSFSGLVLCRSASGMR